MIRYLVSYLETGRNGISHGNAELTLPRPVTSMQDVQMLTRVLREKYGLTQPVVMGFSRFAEPGENGVA
jgi:hypothetical protein